MSIAIASRWSLNEPGRELQGGDVEGGGEGALGVHLAHERALPGAGTEIGEGGGDRRLADAALARDEDQLLVEQLGGHPPKPMRRSPSAVPIST